MTHADRPFVAPPPSPATRSVPLVSPCTMDAFGFEAVEADNIASLRKTLNRVTSGETDADADNKAATVDAGYKPPDETIARGSREERRLADKIKKEQ